MTAPEILAVLKQQHNALDLAMARLVMADQKFFPSRSGEMWDAVIAGNEAIKKLEALCQESG